MKVHQSIFFYGFNYFLFLLIDNCNITIINNVCLIFGNYAINRLLLHCPQHFAKNQHFEENLYGCRNFFKFGNYTCFVNRMNHYYMSYTSSCFSIDGFIVVSVGDGDFPNPVVMTLFNFFYLTELIRTF